MNRDLENAIQDRIEAFSQDMTDLLRKSVLSAMEDALGGSSSQKAKSAPAPRGRPKKVAGKKAAPKKRRGGKRTSSELEKLENDFLKEVKKTTGRRIEEIGKSMGVSTKDLALPVKKLMTDKKIKTTGQRRATRYFAR